MLFYKDTNKNAYEEYYSKLKQLGKLEDYMYKWTEGKKVSKKNKRRGTRGSLFFVFLRSKKRNFKDVVPYLFL